MASLKAVCVLTGPSHFAGVISFCQDSNGPTTVEGEIKGLNPGKHGFHIHALGDTTNGCMSTAMESVQLRVAGPGLNWSASSSVCGECSGKRQLGSSGLASSSSSSSSRGSRAQVTMMGNKNEGKGVFAPIVVLTRNVLGKKEFNQLRGKGIALHSQIITEFCKSIGADAKQRQGLIRLAKKNGEKLGFLA